MDLQPFVIGKFIRLKHFKWGKLATKNNTMAVTDCINTRSLVIDIDF